MPRACLLAASVAPGSPQLLPQARRVVVGETWAIPWTVRTRLWDPSIEDCAGRYVAPLASLDRRVLQPCLCPSRGAADPRGRGARSNSVRSLLAGLRIHSRCLRESMCHRHCRSSVFRSIQSTRGTPAIGGQTPGGARGLRGGPKMRVRHGVWNGRFFCVAGTVICFLAGLPSRWWGCALSIAP